MCPPFSDFFRPPTDPAQRCRAEADTSGAGRRRDCRDCRDWGGGCYTWCSASQRLQPNGRSCQQSQRIHVVGAGGRPPHRSPVQARRDRAPWVAGQQFTDHSSGVQQLPDPYRRSHRLVACVQTAGMGQRHELTAGQHPGVDHRRVTCGVHRLTRGARQVHPAVAAVPVRRRGVEGSQHRRRGPQRPLQSDRLAARRERAHQREGQDPQNPRHPSHRVSSPRHPQNGQPALWTKHLAAPCKLLCAARNYELTSRVCTASPVPLGVRTVCRAVPSHDGSGIAAAARARPQPMPGDNRLT
jgi:hypothetical protein